MAILPRTEGESDRGHWIKGGFIIEQGGEYPRKVAFSMFGEERLQRLDEFNVGDRVVVDFIPKSREYNGNWYTDLVASGIAHDRPIPDRHEAEQPTLNMNNDDDLPF